MHAVLEKNKKDLFSYYNNKKNVTDFTEIKYEKKGKIKTICAHAPPPEK